MQNLDWEGRIITLDYGYLYVCNIYVPNSQGGVKREEYRRTWDAEFRAFLLNISVEKTVVVCGDFNVTLSRADIYDENTRMDFAENGYASDERSVLMFILDDGFIRAKARAGRTCLHVHSATPAGRKASSGRGANSAIHFP